MAALRRLYCFFFLSLAICVTVSADDAGGYQNADAYQNADNANNGGDDYYHADDDGNNVYEAADDGMQGYNYQEDHWKDGDYITYWTEYAILPKRCIVYNDVDVIVFSVFENGYKQCSDDPMGTYFAPVPYFMQGYLNQKEQDKMDQGYEDYEQPDAAQYLYCTPFEIQGQYFYFQIGCADDTSLALAVNIYSDKDCTTRSGVDGYDDSNIDISEISVTFKKCYACVNWFDVDDGVDVDDGFYEKRMTEAPLCSTAWQYREECGRKCQRTGVEKMEREGWNTSDQILLAILVSFGLIMLGLIVRKRQQMSNKETLLEQAAMSTVGLQQPHVIGVFALVVLVIAVFAVLGLKNITWALLLLINMVLFGYLMKLTVDSSVRTGESIIGPDGQILPRDSDDDSSVADSSRGGNAGTYILPTIA